MHFDSKSGFDWLSSLLINQRGVEKSCLLYDWLINFGNQSQSVFLIDMEFELDWMNFDSQPNRAGRAQFR